MELVSRIESKKDQVIKYLFMLNGGRLIETVLLSYPGRKSLCISVQSGCSLDCIFCETGRLPFQGNLTTEEIYAQVLSVSQIENIHITNIIVMGMGEPLMNYDALKAALHKIVKEYKVIERRITVSTAGILPGIKKFTDDRLPYGLSLSLHSASPEKRIQLTRAEAIHPLVEIKAYLQENRHRLTKKQLTLEYVLIKGFNMFDEDIDDLILFIHDLETKVNLIPYNGRETFENGIHLLSPSYDDVNLFWKKMIDRGVRPVCRWPKGDDISGACGMLKASKQI